MKPRCDKYLLNLFPNAGFLALSLLATACSSTANIQDAIKTVEKQCRQQSISLSEVNKEARNSAYHLCLQQAYTRQSPSQATPPGPPKKGETDNNKSAQLQNAEDLYIKCQRNQSEVIRLNKARIRARAELVQAITRNPPSSLESAREIESRLLAIERELQQLMSEEGEAQKSMDLLDSDLLRFKTCARADFIPTR